MANSLIGTPVEAELEKYLSKYVARGTRGKADVTVLEQDGTKVRFHADIRHKHKTNGITVYAMNTSCSGEFDVINPTESDLRVCVDLPSYLGGGETCVSLRDVIDIFPH